jgi:hypothetical protein
MKKILAAGCSVLFLQSFSQVSSSHDEMAEQSGRKVLIKAIAVIVNTDANRKAPPKRVHLPNMERPHV